MKFLIRLLAQWIARRLERGNARAGILGSVLGAVAGGGTAYWLYQADALETFRYAAFVLLPLVGAFVGVLVGSAFPSSGVVRTDRPVRINNLNRALVPLFAFGVFAAIAVWTTIGLPRMKKKEPSLEWKVAGGCGLLALVAGAVALRVVLFVDVTDDGIAVRRVLGSRVYRPHQIKRWGFEVSRGKLVQSAPGMVVPFLIAFDDGFTFESAAVPPATAAALATRLSNPSAPDS